MPAVSRPPPRNTTPQWTTDLDKALADPDYPVFFDAAATHQREAMLERAIAAGKHVYSEKPVALSIERGEALLRAAQARGVKHGAVEDKLGLPGLQKLMHVVKSGFLGRIVGFRVEFGWWVFDGTEVPCQRPSWNYTRAGGGGLILDMYPHWRYIIEGLLGPMRRVVCALSTATPERIDEQGKRYAGRCRGYRLHHRADGKRRDRHHPVVVGDARATRRPSDVPNRRHQRLRHCWPAPLLDTVERRHAEDGALFHQPTISTSTIARTGPR